MRIGDSVVDVGEAKTWLRDKYPPSAVEFYDRGGESPRDRVELSDIGRLTVFGAQLRFDQAVEFLERGRPSRDKLRGKPPPWPDAQGEWDLASGGSGLELQEFHDQVSTQSALALFRHFLGRWNRAQVSKLLHLKWPRFYPILDRALRDVYGPRAVQAHHELSGSRRVKRPGSASTVSYWWVFRQDLIKNDKDLRALRRELKKATPKDERTRRKCSGLGRVTLLRLQDMVTWGIGTGRFP